MDTELLKHLLRQHPDYDEYVGESGSQIRYRRRCPKCGISTYPWVRTTKAKCRCSCRHVFRPKSLEMIVGLTEHIESYMELADKAVSAA